MRLPALVVLPALLAAGCAKEPNFARAQNGWYRGDLHFHSNHSDDALAQGGDDLPAALAIADAYRDPAYVAANPSYAGDGLDFIALTDHRTDVGNKSPEFTHPHLILLPGEEYGGRGHASIWGLKDHIPHEAKEGESQDERHRQNIRAAHAQGALFSLNHPCQDNRWNWTVDEADAVEVWNAPWSAFWGESTPEQLDRTVAEAKGTENPYIRGALAASGGGSNHQALLLWYGMLTRGLHPALVGGSDRHMIVMPGLPTTYVKRPEGKYEGKVGKALGPEGILDGIRARATFVSSHPHGPQVELVATDADGNAFQMGSKVTPGRTYTVTATISRAAGGVVRFVGGAISPGEGPVTAKAVTLSEQAIATEIEERTFTWTVPAGGAWLHAIVLVPRLPDPVPEELAAMVPYFDKLPSGTDLASLIPAFGVMIDSATLTEPHRCDPESWRPYLGQCVPADVVAFGTYYLPDPLLRLANTWFEGGKPTRWSAGALTSAFLAKP